jgi:hypothetical protein
MPDARQFVFAAAMLHSTFGILRGVIVSPLFFILFFRFFFLRRFNVTPWS